MVSSFSNVSLGQSLAEFAAKPRTTSQGTGDVFEKKLLAALQSSLSNAGLNPNQVQVTEAGQQSATGTVPAERHFLVSYTPPTASPASATPAVEEQRPAAQAQTQASAPAADISQDPIQALNAALAAIGLEPGQFNLTEGTDYSYYPGGVIANHYVKANLGNGLSERFTVDLLLRNPSVTATEIHSMLNRPRNA